MRYQHDCSRCVPLGEFEEYDLYVCEQAVGGITLTARWSSVPCEYYSGAAFVGHIPALTEAANRAAEMVVAL